MDDRAGRESEWRGRRGHSGWRRVRRCRCGWRRAALLEGALEHIESIGFFGFGERLASDQIAAGEVGDGEQIAIALVGEHELALVVGAPQIVGLYGLG